MSKHNLRGPDGRFISKRNNTSTGDKRIYEIIVLDTSSSMSGKYMRDAVSGIKKVVDKLRESEVESHIMITGLRRYSDRLLVRLINTKDKDLVLPDYFECTGMTPLLDAIREAFKRVNMLSRDSKYQYNITVFTDGWENDSVTSVDRINSLIEENKDVNLSIMSVSGELGVLNELSIYSGNKVVMDSPEEIDKIFDKFSRGRELLTKTYAATGKTKYNNLFEVTL